MEKKSAKHIRSALSLNIIFTIIQVFGVLYTNSITLLTELVRNIGNILSIGVAYILERRSNRRPSKEFTYGYARYSIIGSLFSTVFLLISSIVVLLTIIPRFISPTPVNYEGMFYFALVGLVLNGIGTFKTFSGKGINEQAVSLHLLEDLLTWIGVFALSIIMRIWDVPILDPIFSVVITVFICRKGLVHLEEAFSIFLEKVPDTISIDEVRLKIQELPDVVDLTAIHIWSLDGIKDYATITLTVKDLTLPKLKKTQANVKEILKDFSIEYSTIEINEE